VAKETPLQKTADASTSACAPLRDVAEAASTSPKLLYQLAAVHCFVWFALTVWNNFGLQFFTLTVYGGDGHADATGEEKKAFAAGQLAFSYGLQGKALLALLSSFLCTFLATLKSIPPRVVYAVFLTIGAVVSLAAAFLVQQNGTMAAVCLVVSCLPEVASFAVPFGLVAMLNQQAVKKGKPDKTGLQMALLNSCITVGQELCIMTKVILEVNMSTQQALTPMFAIGSIVLIVACVGILFIDDDLEKDDDDQDDLDPIE